MKSLDLVQTLQMALEALLVYTDPHPLPQDGLRALAEGMEGWLADKPTLHIAASGGKLLFLDEAPMEAQNPYAAGLVRQLTERQIPGFVIQRDVTQEELLAMLKILIIKPSKLEELGGVAKVMADQKLQRISLSQPHCKEVSKGDPGEGEDLPPDLAFLAPVAEELGWGEELCAFLDNNQEWRGSALAKLRERLCAEDFLGAAVERLHAVEAEEILTTVIPYFEFLGEPAARFLVHALGEETDRKRRGRLLNVIRVMGPIAIPALQEGLRSPTWYFVRNTLNLLTDMGDANLLDEVAACLDHADGRVRRSAARAIWKLGGPAASQPLVACLSETDPETQMEILFGLGQIQAPTAVPVVMELAKNTEIPERIRCRAIETLGQISSPVATPDLLELICRKGRIFSSAESIGIRIACAHALLAIGTPQAELGLRQVVADEPHNQDRDALQRILDLR